MALVPLFYQLCILSGDLRIKHARPPFASEIRQQLCVVLLVQRKAREVPGTSRKPSVSHVIWATCMDHESANCEREAIAHSGTEAEEQHYMKSNNGRNGHVLFKVSIHFLQCHL